MDERTDQVKKIFNQYSHLNRGPIYVKSLDDDTSIEANIKDSLNRVDDHEKSEPGTASKQEDAGDK